MRVVIAGAGEVGFHVAKLLTNAGHDIVVIDTDTSRLDYVTNHLDVSVLKGSSVSGTTLNEARVEKADLLISVTAAEDSNIATSVIGKHMGAKRTIARVSDTGFLREINGFSLKNLGIDELIIPELLAAKEIERLLKQSSATDTFDFGNGTLTLLGINVEEESDLSGRTVTEIASLYPENTFTTVAILHKNKTIIPTGSTVFSTHDHAYFICHAEGIGQITALNKKKALDIKNVAVLGGSRVGINTVERLHEQYNIKLIEKNRDKCYELADLFPDTLIINGDGRDVDLLSEEGIEDVDAFIAVTGDSETNIISSLLAKSRGVDRNVALVENIDYIHLSQNIGVETLINKKLIAANFIFRYIRKEEVVSLTNLYGVDAEVLEFEVKTHSKVLEHRVKDLKFPKDAVLGGVIREGKGYAVRGDFVFQPEDHVVVLCSTKCVRRVEGFFK